MWSHFNCVILLVADSKPSAFNCHDGLAHAMTQAQVPKDHMHWAFPVENTVYDNADETYFSYLYSHAVRYFAWRRDALVSKLPGTIGSECFSLNKTNACIAGASSVLYL